MTTTAALESFLTSFPKAQPCSALQGCTCLVRIDESQVQ